MKCTKCLEIEPNEPANEATHLSLCEEDWCEECLQVSDAHFKCDFCEYWNPITDKHKHFGNDICSDCLHS